jgi:hypothetical protein
MANLNMEVAQLAERWANAFPQDIQPADFWEGLLYRFHPDVIHRKLTDVLRYRDGIAKPGPYFITSISSQGKEVQKLLQLSPLFSYEEIEEPVSEGIKRRLRRSMAQKTILNKITRQRKNLGKPPLPAEDILAEIKSLYRDGKGITIKHQICLVGPVAYDFVAAKVAV